MGASGVWRLSPYFFQPPLGLLYSPNDFRIWQIELTVAIHVANAAACAIMVIAFIEEYHVRLRRSVREGFRHTRNKGIAGVYVTGDIIECFPGRRA